MDVIYDGLDGALTAAQISLRSRNFSPSSALVRIAAEVPAERLCLLMTAVQAVTTRLQVMETCTMY